jgi:hypothetical protein
MTTEAVPPDDGKATRAGRALEGLDGTASLELDENDIETTTST